MDAKLTKIGFKVGFIVGFLLVLSGGLNEDVSGHYYWPSSAAAQNIELELEGNELYRLAWTVSQFYPDLIE